MNIHHFNLKFNLIYQFNFFQNFLFLAGLAEKIENKSKSSSSTSSPTVQPSSPRSENSIAEEKLEADEDPFDKDDSFFVQCSQALDEDEMKSSSGRSLDSNSNHTFKVPEVKRIPSPLIPATKSSTVTSLVTKGSLSKSLSMPTSKSDTAPPSSSSSKVEDNFFDDEDDGEFEMLLSQIELPTGLKSESTITTSTATTSFRSTASAPPPKPVIAQQAPNTKVNSNLVKITFFSFQN
jgi:hypothetical protein